MYEKGLLSLLMIPMSAFENLLAEVASAIFLYRTRYHSQNHQISWKSIYGKHSFGHLTELLASLPACGGRPRKTPPWRRRRRRPTGRGARGISVGELGLGCCRCWISPLSGKEGRESERVSRTQRRGEDETGGVVSWSVGRRRRRWTSREQFGCRTGELGREVPNSAAESPSRALVRQQSPKWTAVNSLFFSSFAIYLSINFLFTIQQT